MKFEYRDIKIIGSENLELLEDMKADYKIIKHLNHEFLEITQESHMKLLEKRRRFEALKSIDYEGDASIFEKYYSGAKSLTFGTYPTKLEREIVAEKIAQYSKDKTFMTVKTVNLKKVLHASKVLGK